MSNISTTANSRKDDVRPQPFNAPALRCRPGDLAIIIRSPRNPAILGRIVQIQEYDIEADRWQIRLMGAPAFGLGLRTGRPLVAHNWLFRDSSLQPLRGGGEVLREMLQEVDHA